MANYDSAIDANKVAFKAMEDSTASKADNVIPKDKTYDFVGMGRDSSRVNYKGFANVEDKSMYWQHPKNKLLYSGEGVRSGYIGEDEKAHFGVPKFEPMETRNEAGDIISQRAYLPGSLEDVWKTSTDVGQISNKYLTAKEGQDYYGFSFPEGDR